MASEAGFSIDSGELRHGVFRDDTAESGQAMMAINDHQDMSREMPPSKFSHQAYINSAERLKLPDIEFRKRTGSYDVDPQSI